MNNQDDFKFRLQKTEKMVNRILDYLSVSSEELDLYNFIEDEKVRRELELDFLLMGKTPADSFSRYCTYAFYQLENLINYYYRIRFLNKEQDAIKYFTVESDGRVVLGKASVSDLSFATKSIKFSKEFLSNLPLNFEIQKISYVRNTSSHKNAADLKRKEDEILLEYERVKKISKEIRTTEEKKAYQRGSEVEFKRSNRFDLVLKHLSSFVAIIKPEICKYQNGLSLQIESS